MKSKIGILTYHTGYNYGASLQAYALQKTIDKLGYDNEIINFETLRFLASREMFSRRPVRLKEIIKIICRIPFIKQLIKRQKLFDDFTANCLNISNLYRTESEVVQHIDDYNCLVCGSDQIWNLSKDDAPAANLLYFLNFPKKQRRVSYAASFGKFVKEAHQYESDFLPWLKQFDSISVRETSGVEYLNKCGIDSKLCLDPTILLDKEEYDEICAQKLVKEKYVLLFGWNTNNDLIMVGKKISKLLNLPLINIVPPPKAMFKGVKRKLDVGPREFLSMIKYADFVVTNSFHGTAFSLTYEKPFFSIYSANPDLRIQSLLKQFNLENRLIQANDQFDGDVTSIDYNTMRESKVKLRESSLSYLKDALKGI